MEQLKTLLTKEDAERNILFDIGTAYECTEDVNCFNKGVVYIITSTYVMYDASEKLHIDYSFETLSDRFKDNNLTQGELEELIAKGVFKPVCLKLKHVIVTYENVSKNFTTSEGIFVPEDKANDEEYISTRICDSYHENENQDIGSFDRDVFKIKEINEVE